MLKRNKLFKYIQQIIVLVFVLTFTSCNNNKETTISTQKVYKGSFDIDIGSTFNIAKNLNTIKYNNVVMYKVNPPSKIKYFDKYYVAITPKTHKIYAVYAEKRYKDFIEASNNYVEMWDILYAKYGKGKDSNGFSLFFTKRGSIIIKTYMNNKDSNKLSFRYTDSFYEDIARKEKIELVKNKDKL